MTCIAACGPALAVSGDDRGAVRVWDVAAGSHLFLHARHGAGVVGLAVVGGGAGGGGRVVVACQDGSVSASLLESGDVVARGSAGGSRLEMGRVDQVRGGSEGGSHPCRRRQMAILERSNRAVPPRRLETGRAGQARGFEGFPFARRRRGSRCQ